MGGRDIALMATKRDEFKVIKFIELFMRLGEKNKILFSTILFFCLFTISNLFYIFNVEAEYTIDGTGMSETERIVEENSGYEYSSNSSIPLMIGKVVGVGLSFVGVLFMILMIYGGMLWMTARGNEQQVTKAKDLIIAAVIGLIIVLSAYVITSYIGGAITS